MGPTEESIEQCCVVIDNLFYTVESPIKALDIAFKSFHALNAKYPPESEQIWLCLQLAIYDLKTKWDRTFASVQTLVATYKQFAE